MNEQLISVKTAKLAKEKEFPFNGSTTYKIVNILQDSLFGTSLTSQSLLQKWLREKHNILVEISFDTVTFGYRIFNPFKSSDYFTNWKFQTWGYEEALEIGLQEALKLI